ncbi:hypothetical protein ABK040_012900 [Willaertia magna]
MKSILSSSSFFKNHNNKHFLNFIVKKRNYSTSFHPIENITYKVISSGNENNNSVPLIILHGLFGSYLNFTTFAKNYSLKNQTNIYLVNLRNHSDEQNHSPIMNYIEMASDLANFIKTQKLEQFDLFGFSLGGKTSMSACLSTLPFLQDNVNKKVRRLIIGDISPLPLMDGDWDIPHVVNSLLKVDQNLNKIKSRHEADDLLKNDIPNIEVRNFLLSNLTRRDNEKPFEWKFNLKAISENLPHLADFPFKTQETIQELKEKEIINLDWKPFTKKTFFLKGEKSQLLKLENDRTKSALKQFFPNYESFQFDNCGHWIHAENPKLFFEKMEEYLNCSKWEASDYF